MSVRKNSRGAASRRKVRRAAQGAVAAAAVTVGTLGLGVAPAHADTNPYNPETACDYEREGNWDLLESHDMGSATVSVSYDWGTGWNCVATIKEEYVGTPTWTIATILDDGVDTDSGVGNYEYFAVAYIPAAGECIRWGGIHQNDSWFSRLDGGDPWVYCGS